jgi:exopolysaccharide production protein ExoQ
MPPLIATFVFAIAISGLFALDRNRKVRTSKAVWLPVIWIWIVGSRPISMWLGIGPAAVTASTMLEGSPLDRSVLQVLLAAGIIVLIRRSSRTSALLRKNWPILLYFSYCLLSVIWSDFPDVAFKRWIKALGDLVMVFIVVTDSQPGAALGRLLSRIGFILLPASILLIKYYGDLGRGFDAWGQLSVTGVTTDKNLLGVTTFLLSLGAAWRVLSLLRERVQPNRGRHLLAQGTLLFFGIALLLMAHSTTSEVCFALGAGLMIATGFPAIGRRPGAVHALVLTVILAGGLAMLFGQAEIVHAMGKQTDFTGRIPIWQMVIPMAPNPMFGAGFESFWLGPRLERVWNAFPVFLPNEAHNGYIEIYLNLGWVGLGLIATILINGYWRAAAVFRRDPGIGGLMLAYIVTATIYSVTEAGFRMLDPIWIFLLLAVVGADSVVSRTGARVPRPLGASFVGASSLAPTDSRVLIPIGRNN